MDYHGESIHAGFEGYKYNIIVSTPGEKAKDILNIDKIYSNLLDLKCNKEWLYINFSDNGLGISRQNKSKILITPLPSSRISPLIFPGIAKAEWQKSLTFRCCT